MDPTHQTLNLFITYVDKEGPFLKVWGQAEKNNSIYVEQFLLGASQSFETGVGKIPFETLQVGTLVCAKYKDNKYYRARIISIDYLNESFIEVNFIDYGNKDIVPSENIRSLQNFPTSFISIPPLATGFIFAEAHCPGGGEWKDQIFEIISKELRYREVQCNLLTQATQYYLIRLFIDNTDIGALFISRGLMQHIPLHAQQAVLLSMSMQRKAPTPPAQAPHPSEINTFKACTLEQNQQYAVYVSFVNEGPTHFSVQLQQSEHMLAKLMKEINEINLRMLEEVPLPGTICLARCQEDGHICRAVVTNEVDNQFKIFYVDFGNYEVLPLEALYQIPFKYVLPKVMAIRLALNGVEKPTVTLEMLLAFKKFVDNRLLYMKVLPSPKKIVIPKCELWDPATKTSALDVINRAAQHAYPEPLLLNRGFTQPIKVSYVFSCNRFYVQLVSKEQELTKVMEDLQLSCQTSETVEDIKIGLPCCALYEADQLWYRSEIVDVVDKENVKVRYIDYGNEEVVPVAHLRMVEGELLTVLRPQAIECCLNGYQNMGSDETRDSLLEELILEQNFTMKVSEMLGKKALVELIDSNNYNVASLLLEKIAASKSQVSPMLVQAGNKIEHRKSSQSSQSDSADNFRGQKKPARDVNKDWNRNDRADGRNSERTNEKSWRNEDKDFRQNDINLNDGSPDGGSWRQNNKGFGKNNNRDNTNDRGDRPRGDRSSINERFNKTRNDRGDDNWNKKDDGFKANTNTWSSPVNDTPAPAADDWETTPSPIQNNFEGRKQRDDRFGGNKRKFDDGGNRGDRGDRGGDRGDRGGRRGDMGSRGDWGDRGDRGGWQNRDGFKKDGYKKDFRKDGSEMSSSGSEKSFKKGPRTSSRNDHGGGRFQNRSNNSFRNTAVNDSWSVSDVSTPIDAAPSTSTFDQQEVVGTEAAVVISWFHNPGHFYCQLQSAQTEFRSLMEEIQQFYKNRKPESCLNGSPVVGLFPEDNVLYRAQVLEALGGQFKVFYVDFGNVSTITKVWPIEKKFMNMPAQAICCGLSGIGPSGDKWPEASTFSKCFQKEEYMARFLEKDDVRTYLQLWDGQEEISQILIKENLAVAVAQEPSGGIEVPLLLNQQFRVVLKSVNNLCDVIVALECGLALNCKAHNLEMASESFEDVLKAYLEQVLIIYVDNILENNILDVTFYDNEGNKLAILIPDEGALDNVEPLCPLLIIRSQIYGYVSHADETSVFIQPSEYAEQIGTLLEKMYETYENITEETSIIPEEGFVYAVHSEDGNWYRGRVTSFDDDKATVAYVDYGNGESIGFSALRELQSEFNVPNIMCLQVTVTTGSAQSYLEKDVAVSIYYGETGWEGAVEEYAQASAELLAEVQAVEGVVVLSGQEESGELPPEDGTLVHESVQGQECSQESAQEYGEERVEEAVAADQHEAAAEASHIADQKGTPVFVSHIDSPTEFYVQFAESATALYEVQQILQDTAEEMAVLENKSVGVLCGAPYSVDHQWYRAEVLDADDDITTVRFVDYGNTDVINNMNTQIKTLPSNLLTPAVYATRCSLKLKAVQDEWNEQALELFEILANQENVVAEFIIQDEKTNIIELYANGQNIKDILLEQGLAVPCEIVTESKTTCFVSHLNSPSEFWVQMENCVDELEWIAEQLSGAEKFPELEDMTPGTLCAALFPDDDMWYRARILSNTIAGIELLFIDYGNSCVSSSLRQLPEDLVVTSPLAQKCCLQRPEGIPYWTKEAQDKFAEISAEGQTIFEMKKISSGETAIVELLLHGEIVVNKILPVTENGYVKNFETLDSFSIEKNGELLPESFSLEPMPGMEWDEESHMKFLELYPEGTLFEIELISEDIVRLYKKGADVRTNLGGVKSSLNLSSTQEDKTENLDVSEDHVIDYEAGGDNLHTKHSSETSIEKAVDTNETEQESAERVIDSNHELTETNQVCDKDVSAETNLQDSGNVDTSSEIVTEAAKDTSNVQDSETDSGHHSEHEVPKEEEKLAEDTGDSKKEEEIEASGDDLQLNEKEVDTRSESPVKEKQKQDEESEIIKSQDNHDSKGSEQEPLVTAGDNISKTEEAKGDEVELKEDLKLSKEVTPDASSKKEEAESGVIQQKEESAQSREATPNASTQKEEAKSSILQQNEESKLSKEITPDASPKKEEAESGVIQQKGESTQSREVTPNASPKKKESESAVIQQKEESTQSREVTPNASPKKEEAKSGILQQKEESKQSREVTPNASPKKKEAKSGVSQQKEESKQSRGVAPKDSPKKAQVTKSGVIQQKEGSKQSREVTSNASPKKAKMAESGVNQQKEKPKQSREVTPNVSPKKAQVAKSGVIQQKEKPKQSREVTPNASPKKAEVAKSGTIHQKEESKQSREVTPNTSPKKEEAKSGVIQQKEEAQSGVIQQKEESKQSRDVTPNASPKKEEAKSGVIQQKEESKQSREVTPNASPKKEEAKSGVSQQKEESKQSREVTPNDSPKKEETRTSVVEQKEESHSRPSSRQGRRISHDDKILPAVYSAPQSPLPDNIEKEERTVTPSEQKEDEPYSRPASAEGGRIKHDDRILPAVLSRPQTPIPDDSESN